MDQRTFAELAEPHRHELRVHCYRMTGSFDEAEDHVQETFLRAWKNVAGFEGRSSVRTWLYRIATNICLDALDGTARRILPDELGDDPAGEVLWLQPYPGPDDAAEARETLELAFLIAVQHLPPRQRAVLILRDVLGWPATETAELLESSVASANSALQRARDTLRDRLPQSRLDWTAAAEPSGDEAAVVRRYMAAMDGADLAAIAGLLAEDVFAQMPPYPELVIGRAANLAALTESWNPRSPFWIGRLRTIATRANGRPAIASYVSKDGVTWRPFGIGILRVADGRIVEMTAFHDIDHLFPAFGLPMSLPADGRLPDQDD